MAFITLPEGSVYCGCSFASSLICATLVQGCAHSSDAGVPRSVAVVHGLVAKRDAWLKPEGADEAVLRKRTLTNLYNERPAWLDLAHHKLDRTVLDAYGWPHDLPDDELLARLLRLNQERAAGQGVKKTAIAADDRD